MGKPLRALIPTKNCHSKGSNTMTVRQLLHSEFTFPEWFSIGMIFGVHIFYMWAYVHFFTILE